MKTGYHTGYFSESGDSFPVRVFLMKDEVTAALDTTGDSLHKKRLPAAYRQSAYCGKPCGGADNADAVAGRPDTGGPFLRERHLSHRGGYDGGEYGAGNEPELYGPGMEASVPGAKWRAAFEEARAQVKMDAYTDIQGYDIDEKWCLFPWKRASGGSGAYDSLSEAGRVRA